jgi:hypothetical protein
MSGGIVTASNEANSRVGGQLLSAACRDFTRLAVLGERAFQSAGKPDRRSRRRHTASCVLESVKETLVWRLFLNWTIAGRALSAHCGGHRRDKDSGR